MEPETFEQFATSARSGADDPDLQARSIGPALRLLRRAPCRGVPNPGGASAGGIWHGREMGVAPTL